MKKLLSEFKKFALKGNVVDMAVGVVIGGAFGTIVKSLVDNVIMPPLGWLIGRVDFSSLAIVINSDTKISYGKFLNSVISFLIIAFVIFIVIRELNRIRIPFLGAEEEEAPTTKTCPFCCSTIPIKARRCPNCTSELPEEETPSVG